VRWFLKSHYTPYDGDGSFLAGATERTKKAWAASCPTGLRMVD
jgi:formate C-acetyltransferase